MSRYDDKLKRKLAWQTAYRARTCPDAEILFADTVDENLARHLSICTQCREEREQKESQESWNELMGRFIEGGMKPAEGTIPQPGQVWTLKKSLGRWNEEGRHINPPAVVLLEEQVRPPGWRVAQLYADKLLAGEGDVQLDEQFGFAQAWNIYLLEPEAFDKMLGGVKQEDLERILSVYKGSDKPRIMIFYNPMLPQGETYGMTRRDLEVFFANSYDSMVDVFVEHGYEVIYKKLAEPFSMLVADIDDIDFAFETAAALGTTYHADLIIYCHTVGIGKEGYTGNGFITFFRTHLIMPRFFIDKNVEFSNLCRRDIELEMFGGSLQEALYSAAKVVGSKISSVMIEAIHKNCQFSEFASGGIKVTICESSETASAFCSKIRSCPDMDNSRESCGSTTTFEIKLSDSAGELKAAEQKASMATDVVILYFREMEREVGEQMQLVAHPVAVTVPQAKGFLSRIISRSRQFMNIPPSEISREIEDKAAARLRVLRPQVQYSVASLQPFTLMDCAHVVMLSDSITSVEPINVTRGGQDAADAGKMAFQVGILFMNLVAAEMTENVAAKNEARGQIDRLLPKINGNQAVTVPANTVPVNSSDLRAMNAFTNKTERAVSKLGHLASLRFGSWLQAARLADDRQLLQAVTPTAVEYFKAELEVQKTAASTVQILTKIQNLQIRKDAKTADIRRHLEDLYNSY